MNFIEATRVMSNGGKVMKRMWAPGHWITWDATNSAFVDDGGTRLPGFHPSDILSEWEEWIEPAPLKPCPFCGDKPLVRDFKDGTRSIECSNARCNIFCRTRAVAMSEAISIWDKRA